MWDTTDTAERLTRDYQRTRRLTERFCEPLELEDYCLQAMPETSPPKWHLAHTTWFFETFVLKPFQARYEPWHPQYEFLFNSYYNSVGEQFPRPQRGLLSRPSLDEVMAYRAAVDRQVLALLGNPSHPQWDTILARVELGVQHEQQHQELFFTDVKYSLSLNPLNPAYLTKGRKEARHGEPAPLNWHAFEGGFTHIGCTDEGFCFDNERPAHRAFLQPFALASRLTTNAEYLEFVQDDGYRRPELWLADGWTLLQQQRWQMPLYWRTEDGKTYHEYTLNGLEPLVLARPVSHLSAYEADAYARWRGARLPTEFEWEAVAQHLTVEGQFVESGELHPQPVEAIGLQQMFGTLWEWTSSAYSAYPGFKPAAGAIGEYNGKFMCNQWVLRGGSCMSSRAHLRSSYRNFFYPRDRWQFTGLRLAKD